MARRNTKDFGESLQSIACMGSMTYFILENMDLPEWLSKTLSGYVNKIVDMLSDISNKKILLPEKKDFLMFNLVIYLGHLTILLKEKNLIKFEPGFVEAVHQDIFKNVSANDKVVAKLLNETVVRVSDALEMSERNIHDILNYFDFPILKIVIHRQKDWEPCVFTTEDEEKYGEIADRNFEKFFGNFLKNGKIR